MVSRRMHKRHWRKTQLMYQLVHLLPSYKGRFAHKLTTWAYSLWSFSILGDSEGAWKLTKISRADLHFVINLTSPVSILGVSDGAFSFSFIFY